MDGKYGCEELDNRSIMLKNHITYQNNCVEQKHGIFHKTSKSLDAHRLSTNRRKIAYIATNILEHSMSHFLLGQGVFIISFFCTD